jgi:hypothetical protein
MAHLELDRIVDLIAGQGAAEERAHLDSCPRCGDALEVWRRRLQELRSLEHETVEPSELHSLRTLFSQLGPSPRVRSWLADLVRRSDPVAAAAAARGGLSTSFEQYQAGPWDLVIQIKPSEAEHRYDLHGQITGGEDRRPEGAEAVLVSDEGYGERVVVDSYGEFRFQSVPPGIYSASWRLRDERIEIEELGVGDRDDQCDA